MFMVVLSSPFLVLSCGGVQGTLIGVAARVSRSSNSFALEQRHRQVISIERWRESTASIECTNAAATASPLAAKGDPPLKPNQPNQRSAVPSATKGMLCGSSKSSPSATSRLPTMRIVASAEKPAVKVKKSSTTEKVTEKLASSHRDAVAARGVRRRHQHRHGRLHGLSVCTTH